MEERKRLKKKTSCQYLKMSCQYLEASCQYLKESSNIVIEEGYLEREVVEWYWCPK